MGSTIKAAHRDIARDPREDEDWFQRMPVQAQDEMREKFRAEKTRYGPRFERLDLWRNRCLREGLLSVTGPCLMLFHGWVLLLSIPLGLATGWIWFQAQTGRLTSGGISMAAVALASVIGGSWRGAAHVEGFVFTAFLAFVAGLLGAACGLRRELDEREQA